MAEASDTLGILYQNLLDAGCNEKNIEECMGYARKQEWNSLLPVLTRHKSMLLDTVHSNQEKIECLDFLIYTINKQHS